VTTGPVDDAHQLSTARYRESERRLWRSVGVTPTEQQLALERTGVSVRVQHVGEGPTVLFVHGLSTAGTSWAPLVARLDDYRCIILDRPGCGLSDPIATPVEDLAGLEAFADALIVDVLDTLDVDTAAVVATSLGGYVALRTAATHPNRIRQVIELGWTVGAPIARIPPLMRIAAIPALARMMTSLPPTRRAVRAMLRHTGLRRAVDAGHVTNEMIDWYWSLIRHTDTMRNEIEAGARLTRPIRGLDQRLLLPARLLAAIPVPVGFLWGDDDIYGGTDTAHTFVTQIPNAQLEFMPQAGHAPWLDDPDQAANVARRYLDQ
jgi:2-hydroxy-6-oxonona-2,4-dienedioate hydrolase